MSKSKHFYVGIIAEDESDVDAMRVLIERIAESESICIKKFVGKGCGKIKRKCNSWASTLKAKRCQCLILIHDLDKNHQTELKKQIEDALSPCPINPYLICIPVEELEAWLLADPDAIYAALNLDKIPKIPHNPESIKSPKEHIGTLVKRCSSNQKIYINTKHNKTIAEKLNIDKAKHCKSFIPFYQFVITNIKG